MIGLKAAHGQGKSRSRAAAEALDRFEEHYGAVAPQGGGMLGYARGPNREELDQKMAHSEARAAHLHLDSTLARDLGVDPTRRTHDDDDDEEEVKANEALRKRPRPSAAASGGNIVSDVKRVPKLGQFKDSRVWKQLSGKFSSFLNRGKNGSAVDVTTDENGTVKVRSLIGDEESELKRQLEADEDSRAEAWRMRAIRRKARLLFDDPHSSTAAYCIAVTILTMIVVSSILFTIDTIDEVKSNDNAQSAIELLETIFIICFTAEYVVRMWASENWMAFPFEGQNLIDFAAIIPWYIEFTLAQSGGSSGGLNLGFLRLARVFRVFKLSRYGNKMQMVFDALNESRDILSMLMVNLVIIIIVFSSITYYAEKPNNSDEFTNIPKTCWWCIVTVLTVGYGDMAPKSIIGRLTAAMLMVLSLIVLALPITIIGSCFSNAWVAWKDEQKLKDRLELLPKTFKSIYPPLTQLADDMSDNNVMLREKSEEVANMLDQLREALECNRLGEQNVLLQDLSKSTDACMMLLSDNLVETHALFDEVLTQIRSRAAEGRRLRMHVAMLMEQAKKEMKVAFGNLVRGRATFTNNEGTIIDLTQYSCILDVHVVGARGLEPKDINGTSDPYVTVTHGNEERVSSVMYKSLNPMWDEHLIVLISNTNTPLSIEVYDKDVMTKDDLLGRCAIDLRGLELERPIESWYELKQGQGQLKLVLTMYDVPHMPQQALSEDVMNAMVDRVYSIPRKHSLKLPQYNIIIQKQAPPALNETERDHDREREKELAEMIKMHERQHSETKLKARSKRDLGEEGPPVAAAADMADGNGTGPANNDVIDVEIKEIKAASDDKPSGRVLG